MELTSATAQPSGVGDVAQRLDGRCVLIIAVWFLIGQNPASLFCHVPPGGH
ncbi:MAG: hypothetical protein IPG06_10435 [Haliea sp.]|nr:hypothetical protein [Haliea sp.]